MARRISIALLMLAFFWVGEPAFALWSSASEHACCLPKPAAMPSCHGMARHDAASASFAARHSHSDCPHDCCTKQRMGGTLALVSHTGGEEAPRTSTIISASGSTVRAIAIYAVSFERGPPTLS